MSNYPYFTDVDIIFSEGTQAQKEALVEYVCRVFKGASFQREGMKIFTSRKLNSFESGKVAGYRDALFRFDIFADE